MCTFTSLELERTLAVEIGNFGEKSIYVYILTWNLMFLGFFSFVFCFCFGWVLAFWDSIFPYSNWLFWSLLCAFASLVLENFKVFLKFKFCPLLFPSLPPPPLPFGGRVLRCIPQCFLTHEPPASTSWTLIEILMFASTSGAGVSLTWFAHRIRFLKNIMLEKYRFYIIYFTLNWSTGIYKLDFIKVQHWRRERKVLNDMGLNKQQLKETRVDGTAHTCNRACQRLAQKTEF